jgi:predicted ArsR family transcriptional regulator
MSNNQLLQVVDESKVGSSKVGQQISAKRPSIVHELDRKIFNILKKQGPLTRSKLVSITGIARSTLYDCLLRLILKGYVVSFSEERRHRGRPRVFYKALN